MSIDTRNPVPLHQQIAENIRAEILSGKLKKDERLGSHQDLVRRYGVSLITVKRALRDLANQGLLYSRVGKGTFVSGEPPVVEFSQHRAIGLVLRDLKSPFFSTILHSVEAHASRHEFNVLVSSSSEQIAREESQIRHFRAMGVSGLIIASMTHEYRATGALRDLHDSGYPYVMVSYVQDPEIYFVGTDHEQGGYLATLHLITIGYKSIGYINGETGNLVGELRRTGYRRALEDHGLACNEEWESRLRRRGEWFDYESGYEIGARFAKLSARPDAMFVYNALAALGFQEAVLTAGLSVPRDVAIVGFDGIERGEYAPVPLTTIRQSTDEIGSRAVEVLLSRIDGRSVQTRTILQGELVIRQSCGALVSERGQK